MSQRRAAILLTAALTLTATAAALLRFVAGPEVFQPASAQEASVGGYDAVLQACHSANPYFAVARFVRSPQGPSNRSTLVAVHDTESTDKRWDEEDQVSLAQHAQIGSVNGVAYDWQRHRVYVAAYHRVFSAFGPGGSGAVYQVDLGSGDVKEFVNLPAGQDRHGDALRDAAARPWINRTSLGDIDVDATASTLFVTNLEDRRIYRFTLPDGRAIGSFPHGAAAELWARNARPFGLGFHDGWLYHGVVDTREDSGLPGTLAAYVYRSRADGSEMRQVLRADLSYSRQVPWGSWIDPSETDDPAPAQPYVADIEFRENGDLVLGLADRTRDMGVSGPANGDLLPAQRIREDEWTVADGARSHYADPVKASQAPLGALALMPGLDVLVAAMEFSPAAGGIVWYDNETGRRHQPVDGANGCTATRLRLVILRLCAHRAVSVCIFRLPSEEPALLRLPLMSFW